MLNTTIICKSPAIASQAPATGFNPSAAVMVVMAVLVPSVTIATLAVVGPNLQQPPEGAISTGFLRDDSISTLCDL